MTKNQARKIRYLMDQLMLEPLGSIKANQLKAAITELEENIYAKAIKRLTLDT